MTSRIHALKCWPGPFQAMLDGRKRFEWRKDDRGYDIGDVLLLREWDPGVYATWGHWDKEERAYTKRSFKATVTYVLRGQFGMPEGYVVMGISDPLPE